MGECWTDAMAAGASQNKTDREVAVPPSTSGIIQQLPHSVIQYSPGHIKGDTSSIKHTQQGITEPLPSHLLLTILEDGSKKDKDETERAAAIASRKAEAQQRRKKKKKTASSTSLASNTFQELYIPGWTPGLDPRAGPPGWTPGLDPRAGPPGWTPGLAPGLAPRAGPPGWTPGLDPWAGQPL